MNEGCRVSLNVDKVKYDFGEPINIGATVQNVSREKLWVEGNQLRFPYRFEIYGPNSDETPLTLWGNKRMKVHSGSLATELLSKGEKRSDTFSMLNRTFDMSLPGKYAIVVHRVVRSELDPNAWIDVMSNTVVVEVGKDK